jgi:hypothetical protein
MTPRCGALVGSSVQRGSPEHVQPTLHRSVVRMQPTPGEQAPAEITSVRPTHEHDFVHVWRIALPCAHRPDIASQRLPPATYVLP